MHIGRVVAGIFYFYGVGGLVCLLLASATVFGLIAAVIALILGIVFGIRVFDWALEG